MIIDKELLDNLSAQAKNNSRLKQTMDLETSQKICLNVCSMCWNLGQ